MAKEAPKEKVMDLSIFIPGSFYSNVTRSSIRKGTYVAADEKQYKELTEEVSKLFPKKGK